MFPKLLVRYKQARKSQCKFQLEPNCEQDETIPGDARSQVKLLIFSPAFWPQIGGTESLVMTLARGIAAAPSKELPRDTKISENTEANIDVTVVTQTPAGSVTDTDLPFHVVRQPRLRELLLLLRKSDLVHMAGPAMLPLALALMMRKPVALEHNGFQAICPNGQLLHEPTCTTCPGHFMAGHHQECWKCNAQYESTAGSKQGLWGSMRMWALTFPRRWMCRLVSANIAPTHFLKDVLRLPRTHVIWHGVPSSPGPVPRSRSAGNDRMEQPTFVFVGRLVSTKGIHLLLEAAHKLRKENPSFRVQVIGNGPARLSLEEKCRKLGLEKIVHFWGYLPEGEAEDILNSGIAVVMPSIAGEAFGLVAAENMARGRLMIVPNYGALAEVTGDTGLKFKAGDAEHLASCLESVLRSPDVAIALGEKARSRSLDVFNESGMIAKHLDLYRALLREH
jgi:glycosyltransferase involved in cell wall biosynthesis